MFYRLSPRCNALSSEKPPVALRQLLKPCLLTLATAALSPFASAQHIVPLFPSASDSTLQGFARVINHSPEAGELEIGAQDEAGKRFGPLSVSIGPGQVVHFNSDDLEEGNPDKGLSGGIGIGTGDWRLELSSALDLEVLSYIRTSDGFLTAMHDLAPMEGGRYSVVIFNPGSNPEQVSQLRLTNTGSGPVEVSIKGVDDAGRSPGSEVRLSIPAGASRALTASELEAGGSDLDGALGVGTGKWRLSVESDQPLSVLSLLESPTGHLTNLSTPSPGPSDNVHRALIFPSVLDQTRQGFARVVNHSSTAGVVNVLAYDDTGRRFGPLRLSIDADETAHFNSEDLDRGNATKGLLGSIEPGEGPWRLELWSDLDIEVLSYIRTADGFLTSMHDVVPSTDAGHRVAVFNPGSNRAQMSRLRMINPGGRDAHVVIKGVDDQGESPGSWVRTTVPAGAARSFTAAQLESGTEGLVGTLGDGTGKWRLSVESDEELLVMSLLESPTGHLTNLSTEPGRDTDWPIVAGTTTDLFGALISGPIIQSKCVSCHVVGGDAADTRLVFASSTELDHESLNYQRFEDFLRQVENGADLILEKAQGIDHEGGEQLSPDTNTFADLERFLMLLEEDTPFEGASPAAVIALGPLAGSDVTVTSLGEPAVVVDETITDNNGEFVVPESAIGEDRLLYLVEVSGGNDGDANDDGTLDGPHINEGALRALLTADQLAEGAKISVISDIAWRYTSPVPSALAFAENLERLRRVARDLIAQDLDGDGVLNHVDLAAFDPGNSAHRQALAFHPESLAEPFAEDGLSALDAWLRGDDDSLTDKLDSILGERLSPFHEGSARTRTVTVTLVPFGNGTVESSDLLLNYDPDEPSQLLERIYLRNAEDITFQARPDPGSELLGWEGCDSVTPNLQTCEISLDEDRVVEVLFGYSEPEIVDNFADLTEASSSIDGDGKLSVEVPAGNTALTDRMDDLSAGDFVVASAGEGVLVKVNSIQRIDAQHYELQTTPATLPQVVRQGSVRYREPLTEGDLAETIAGQGTTNGTGATSQRVRSNGPSHASELAFSPDYPGVSLLLSGDSSSTEFVIEFGSASSQRSTRSQPTEELAGEVVLRDGNGNEAKLRGRIAMEITPDWAVNWSNLLFDGPEFLRFVAIITTTEELDATIGADWDSGERSMRLGTIRFKPKTVKIRGVPIKLNPQVEVYLGAQGMVGASASAGVTLQQTVRAGFVYDAELGSRQVFTFDQIHDFREPTAEVKGEASVWIEPRVSVRVFGGAGPQIALRAFIRLRGATSTADLQWRQGGCTNYSPFMGWLGLSGRLELAVGQGQVWNVLGTRVADFIANNLKTSLFRREWPLPTPILTVDLSAGRTFRDKIRGVDAHGELRPFLGPELGPVMVVIPSGKFRMGFRSEWDDYGHDLPQHDVTISQPFAMSKYEITLDDYARYCAWSERFPRFSDGTWQADLRRREIAHQAGVEPCGSFRVPSNHDFRVVWRYWNPRSPSDFRLTGQHPATMLVVTSGGWAGLHWESAHRYVEWLSWRTGKRYRMASEAEWEYATRAGTTTWYYWGELPDPTRMGSSSRPFVPVGSFPPSPWCQHDLHGNAPEWVQDCWHDDYWGCGSDQPSACKADPKVAQLIRRKRPRYRYGPFPACAIGKSDFPRPERCPETVPDDFGDDRNDVFLIGCFRPEHCPEEPLAPTDGSAWGEEDGGNCRLKVVRGHTLRNYGASVRWHAFPKDGVEFENLPSFPGGITGSFGFRVVRELDNSTNP